MEGHSDVGSSFVIVSFGSDAGSQRVGGFARAWGESEDGLQVAVAIRFCIVNVRFIVVVGFIGSCVIDVVVDVGSLTSSARFAWSCG